MYSVYADNQKSDIKFKRISCIIYNLTAILNFFWKAGKYFMQHFVFMREIQNAAFFME